MINVRWRKVLRDLWLNDVRTLLAIVAIVVGIFGTGSVLNAYAILSREINVNFANTNPPSAILHFEEVDSGLLNSIANRPDIESAEARILILGRVLVGTDEWKPLALQVIDDFDNMTVSTFTGEEGEWPPATGNILMERASVSMVDDTLTGNITIQINTGVVGQVTVSGIVHDARRAPGWQDGYNFGYITASTLETIGEPATFNELHIIVAENVLDKEYITDVAYEIRDDAETQGYTVTRIEILEPGVHPHSDQMNSVMFLLASFGVLTLILSAILVTNIVSALLAQQTRQIGAMKAIGARTSQIANLYLSSILAYGLIALIFAVPMARVGGNAISAFIATLLNFNVTSDYIPPWVYVVLILLGLLVPIVSALIPIWRGSQITVREAISDYGVGNKAYGTGFFDLLISRLRGFSRPVLLSLRNTFRRQVRLILIVAILTAGGAAFMTTLNVRASWVNTINITADTTNYELAVSFAQPYAIDDLEATIATVPDVLSVESWMQSYAYHALPQNRDGKRFVFNAIPTDTDLIDFPLMQGRWLQADDTNAIVLNQSVFLDPEFDYEPGDMIPIRIGGQNTEWELVGVVFEISAPKGYVNLDTFNNIMGTDGLTNAVHIQTTDDSQETLHTVSQNLESTFDDAGYLRTGLQSSKGILKILADHIVVLVSFLAIMAVLIAIVGALALASVIGINVMERSREIGIMRAIGASTSAILQVIMVEALFIGFVSWLFSIALARPVSVIVGNYAGQIFLQNDLSHVFPVEGVIAWFAIVMFISMLASFFPAWSASQLTVREVLAYE